MGAYRQSVVQLNITAAGTIAKKRFITRTGTQAGADANTLGVSEYDAVTGDQILCSHLGIAAVEAGAAIASNVAERRLKSDATGRAVTWTTGVPVVAILVPGQQAAAAGQEISVILVQN